MYSKYKFKTIGICGSGKMALSFLELMLTFEEFNIVMYIRNPENLQRISEKYMRRISSNPLYDNRELWITFTGDVSELGQTDIVFEFVSEDVRAKIEMLEKLLKVRKNHLQVIATGSSSIIPREIHPSYGKLNLFGVHFIYPVQINNIAEIIYGEDSKRDVLENIKVFIEHIGKRPVLLHEDIGAFTIRVMCRTNTEAFNLLQQYELSPDLIDSLMEEENFISPPFLLCDSVGFNIIKNSILTFYEDTEDYSEFYELLKYLDRNIHNGSTGKKAGMGFYNYDLKHSKKSVCKESIDSEILEIVVSRLKMRYLNTCFKILDGCWTSSEELDSIMTELYSVPKGPIELAFDMGLENILKKMEEYSEKYDKYFKPPDILKYSVSKNCGRDEIDEQIRMFKVGGNRPGWYNPYIKQII